MLLGSCLVAWFLDFCRENKDPLRVINLSTGLLDLLVSGLAEDMDELVNCGMHVRSFLFWQYIVTGHQSPELIKAGVSLLAACTKAKPSCFEQSEFILAQDYVCWEA